MIVLNFDDAYDRLMGHEGGYVNDPEDPGGETKWGISKRSYPHLNIKELTRDQAKEIYREDFWKPLNQNLPDGVLFQAFDFAVNSGISTAIRHLQKAVDVADDGHWGSISQKAALVMTESDLIMKLLGERLEFMTKLKNWPVHGKGWARRIATNLRYGAMDS